MAFLTEDQITIGSLNTIATEQDKNDAIALQYDDQVIDTTDVSRQAEEGGVMAAAFRMENSLGSFIANAPFSAFQEQDDYSPFDDERELEGYEDNALDFADSVSPEHTTFIKSQIDRERADKNYLDSEGFTGGVASFAAGMIDPIQLASMFIPGGAAMKAGSIIKTAAATAAGGAVGDIAIETGLHATQYTRTIEESAVNVASGVLLGGLLGGGIQAFSNSQRKKLATDISDHFTAKSTPGSVGAAKVFNTTLDQETMKAAGISKLTLVSPGGRTMQSASKKVREISQRLAENNFTLKKNDEGIASYHAAETMIKRWDAVKFQSHKTVSTQYANYKKGFAERKRMGTGAQLNGVSVEKPLSRLEFQSAVGKAMRRNDESFVPEVRAVAKDLRQFYDSTAKELVDLGLLNEADLHVKTAPTYLNRVYDFTKIEKERHKFANIIQLWMTEQDIKAHRSEERRVGKEC